MGTKKPLRPPPRILLAAWEARHLRAYVGPAFLVATNTPVRVDRERKVDKETQQTLVLCSYGWVYLDMIEVVP